MLSLTEAVVDGRVASFRAGVPSGPTGRDNHAGQLQADRCRELKLLLPDSDSDTSELSLIDSISQNVHKEDLLERLHPLPSTLRPS